MVDGYLLLRITVVLIAGVFAIECKGSDLKHVLTELPVKPSIPALILPDKEGNAVNIHEIESPIIVINFWATWCSSCVREMRTMNQAAKELSRKDVMVISINVGESQYKITNFFREYEPVYKVLSDYQSSTMRQWQVQGLPTTYVIGPDKKIHYGAIGLLAWDSDDVQQQILSLQQSGK